MPAYITFISPFLNFVAGQVDSWVAIQCPLVGGVGGSLYHTQLFQTLKSDFSALLDDPGGPLVRSSTCCNALMHGAGAHHTLWQLCPHPQLPQRPKDTLTILLLPQAPSKPFRVTGPIQLTSLSPQLISLKPVSITVEGSDNT